jgi:hypothetical protein
MARYFTRRLKEVEILTERWYRFWGHVKRFGHDLEQVCEAILALDKSHREIQVTEEIIKNKQLYLSISTAKNPYSDGTAVRRILKLL